MLGDFPSFNDPAEISPPRGYMTLGKGIYRGGPPKASEPGYRPNDRLYHRTKHLHTRQLTYTGARPCRPSETKNRPAARLDSPPCGGVGKRTHTPEHPHLQ